MSVTPVLAESQRAFDEYIRQHQLNTRHFSYIRNEWNLRGYRGLVVTVGRWWRNGRYRTEGFYEEINSLIYKGDISIIQGTWDSQSSRLKTQLLL